MTAIPLKQGKFGTGLIGRGLEGFQNGAAIELQPSGVTELDAVLGGGFPRDSLVELCGPTQFRLFNSEIREARQSSRHGLRISL